jgi:flavin reductase (DIM6/NTAB) family NADH-FMN oxidoreductase RutF
MDQPSPQTMTGEIHQTWFRRVLGHFPTGVVIVTAISGGDPAGLSVGSFTSVSLDPPLVAILPSKASTSWPRIAAAGTFCINILAASQERLCRTFAVSGADKFAGVSWHPAPSGAPILDGSLAWIDCGLERCVDAGDHFIVLGRVRALDLHQDQMAAPLIFFQGGYGTFGTHVA